MSKKIIIAGAGHGGLACAALLSRNGFDVTVYEKCKRRNLGYDWTDTVDIKSFETAEIELPKDKVFEKSTNITFCTPYESSVIVQDIEDELLTVKIERKELYDILINNAEKSGVKFEFGCEIISPILIGDRTVGIKTKKGDFYADLVIDACGCDSVVRKQLPDCVGIQKETGKYERFYVYRGIYSKGKEALHKYKVYLMPNGKMGIGWVISDKNTSDVLIGKFEPFGEEEKEEQLAFFREKNSVIGNKLIRGGCFEEIPVRHTLSILVSDGYAAIGDSAFMTIPLLGSGISNSFNAAKILSDVIINDETQTYSAETLWDYQKKYYEKIGFAMAKMAVIRCMLPKLTASQIDYVFESGIITSNELTISSDTSFSPDVSIIKRAIAIIKDRDLLSILAKAVTDIGRLTALTGSIPEEYSRSKVINWSQKYNKIFEI